MADGIPLQIEKSKVQRPCAFLNPTKYYLTRYPDADDKRPSNSGIESPPPKLHFVWSSRNNRKGRHAIYISPADAASKEYDIPQYSDSFKVVAKTVWKMLTYYPVWDISWLGAYVFTIGSVLWVINGFVVWQPWTNDPVQSEVYWAGGLTAFFGATIYEIGSVFLMLEAFNANRSGCFGWAFEQLVTSEGDRVLRATPDRQICSHHHLNKSSLLKPPQNGQKQDSAADVEHHTGAWIWWPSEKLFETTFAHDLGFWASSSQMVGATVFWISGVTSLPGIYNNLSPDATTGAYWVPQIVGAVFFVISGALFMLETQKKWWMPALGTLGWHIGFWNMIGGVGFTLCPIFGLIPAQWAQYQSSCSTFWGSWAFLIGSVIQWYESMNKHPVERKA